MNIESMKEVVISATARKVLVAKKYSPEILVGVGIVGFIATTIMASKATLKVNDILKETDKDLETIKNVHKEALAGNPSFTYTETDYRRDLAITYSRRGMDLAKLYGPAVIVGTFSVGCILASQGIMKKRNLGLIAAYKLLDDTFSSYRDRVIEDQGKEKDLMYRHGFTVEEVKQTTTDENGKKVKTKEPVVVYDGREHSEYARFFDEYSVQWQKDAAHNLFFLRSQQNTANDLLKSRGHIFLNEVYDLLGIPRSKAGAVVGWVYDNAPGNVSDNYVDFGIYDPDNQSGREIVNGYNRSVLLDFNVDGIIYDLI